MIDSPTAAQSGRTRDILALAFAITFPTLITLIYFEWLEGANAQIQQIAFAIGKIIQFGFPLVWVWLWYRNRLRTFSPFAKDKPEKVDRPSDHHWASKHANGIGVACFHGEATQSTSHHHHHRHQFHLSHSIR